MRPALHRLLLALALTLAAPLVLADHEHGGHEAAAVPARLDQLSPAGAVDCCPTEGADQCPGPADKPMDGGKCPGKGDCKGNRNGAGPCADVQARELRARLHQLERRLDLIQAVLEDLLERQAGGRCQCGGGKHGGH